MASSTTSLPINAVLALTSNSQLIGAIRPELKKVGLGDVEFVPMSQPKELLRQLDAFESPLVIIDWDLGPQICLLAMQAIRRQHRIESTPIFLVTSDVTDKILAAATEFCVSKINTGTINNTTARVLLQELVDELSEIDPIRKLLNEAERLRRQDKIEDAQKILMTLIAKAPNNQRVAATLAEAFITQEEWERAAALLGPFQDTVPTPTRLLYLYGRCLMKAGYPQSAAQAFSKCQSINPFHADRLCDLGNALLRMGEPEGAYKEFKAAEKLEKNHRGAINGQGTVKLMQGQINEALALLNPHNNGFELASIFNMAAILTMRSGDHEKGLALYDAAIATLKKMDDVVAKVYFNKGLGFVRIKDADRAKHCFQQALKWDPNFSKARENLNILEKKATRVSAKEAISNPLAKFISEEQPSFSQEELDFLNAMDE